MGTRVQHIVFDDLDHSTDNVATYRFALEGVPYEIDLSSSTSATCAPPSPRSSPPAAGSREPRRTPPPGQVTPRL